MVFIEGDTPEESFYVGINGFIGFFKSKSNIDAYNKDDSMSISYFKVGYIFSSNNRVELTLIDDATLSYETFDDRLSGLNLNVILPYRLSEEGNTFLKAQGGTGVYDYSVFGLEGVSLSGGLGIIYTMNKDIEVDIYYLYQYIYWKDFKDIAGSSEIDNTSLKGISFGAKYKF